MKKEGMLTETWMLVGQVVLVDIYFPDTAAKTPVAEVIPISLSFQRNNWSKSK